MQRPGLILLLFWILLYALTGACEVFVDLEVGGAREQIARNTESPTQEANPKTESTSSAEDIPDSTSPSQEGPLPDRLDEPKDCDTQPVACLLNTIALPFQPTVPSNTNMLPTFHVRGEHALFLTQDQSWLMRLGDTRLRKFGGFRPGTKPHIIQTSGDAFLVAETDRAPSAQRRPARVFWLRDQIDIEIVADEGYTHLVPQDFDRLIDRGIVSFSSKASPRTDDASVTYQHFFFNAADRNLVRIPIENHYFLGNYKKGPVDLLSFYSATAKDRTIAWNPNTGEVISQQTRNRSKGCVLSKRAMLCIRAEEDIIAGKTWFLILYPTHDFTREIKIPITQPKSGKSPFITVDPQNHQFLAWSEDELLLVTDTTQDIRRIKFPYNHREMSVLAFYQGILTVKPEAPRAPYKVRQFDLRKRPYAALPNPLELGQRALSIQRCPTHLETQATSAPSQRAFLVMQDRKDNREDNELWDLDLKTNRWRQLAKKRYPFINESPLKSEQRGLCFQHGFFLFTSDSTGRIWLQSLGTAALFHELRFLDVVHPYPLQRNRHIIVYESPGLGDNGTFTRDIILSHFGRESAQRIRRTDGEKIRVDYSDKMLLLTTTKDKARPQVDVYRIRPPAPR